MAKKTVKKNVVTPDPKNVKIGIPFEDLADGEYFIMYGQLWQKLDSNETCQAAYSISGGWEEDLCDKQVIPDTVTITWEVK